MTITITLTVAEATIVEDALNAQSITLRTQAQDWPVPSTAIRWADERRDLARKIKQQVSA